MAEQSGIETGRVYPSMTALRMLNAVSRLGNMHKAAEALCVTPSAVSHQLRKLEQTLGVKLLNRNGRRVELTSAGNRYVQEIRKALEIVERANLPLGQSEPYGPLRINCASGLGGFWLTQHIGEFLDLYPNVDIEVTSTTDRIDILGDEIDFSILYGDGSWPGLYVQHLFTPRSFPVCAPALIERHGRIKNPEDLAAFPLIHHRNHSDWVVWLSAATKKSVQLGKGMVFSDVAHSISAAIAGNGIAIGDDILTDKALKEGLLVRPFETEIKGPQAYYIVGQNDRMQRGITRIAAEWLGQRFLEYTLMQSG